MALPTLEKTWVFDVNNVIAVGGSGGAAGYGELMFQWKTFLTAGTWVVVSSCDASSVSASDLWINAAACDVHGGPGETRSWIVLQNDAIATGFQMMVECRENGGGANSVMHMRISEAVGFTGGTTLASPSAADEVVPFILGGSEQWAAGQDLTSNPAHFHMARSTDGEITRWWLYVAGTFHMLVSVEKPADPVPGWTIPWAVLNPIDRYASTNYLATYTYLSDSNAVFASGAKGSRTGMYLTSEGAVGNMLGQLMTFGADLDGGAYPFFPPGIWCDEAGARGRLGRLTDVWWGSTTAGDGDHYPGDSSRLFVQVGDLILPWPGGGPMITA